LTAEHLLFALIRPAHDCHQHRSRYASHEMIDFGFLLVITTLLMALIALFASLDHPGPRGFRNHADSDAIELPPFGLPWLDLYDGLDVAEHLRRELRPASKSNDAPPAGRASVGPYR
jgi:hypothetical protein